MSLYERHGASGGHRPVLVVVLEGWVDAGLGADGAIAALLGSSSTELVATFDGDTLIDQRARRPVVHLVDGVNQGLTWPVIQLRAGHDAAGADVCYLIGPEPDFHWPAFTRAVVELGSALDVRLVVGLGAFPAPAPHTRPVRLAATAPPASAELVAGVGTVTGALDVPSGIWNVLELGFGEAGIPAIGLWARVPHYVAGMAFPAASAALVDGLVQISGLAFDTVGLHGEADVAIRQVDDLIARSAEHTAMVHKLEQSLDAVEGNPLEVGQIPTGDELADELERYLRQQPGPEEPPGDR